MCNMRISLSLCIYIYIYIHNIHSRSPGIYSVVAIASSPERGRPPCAVLAEGGIASAVSLVRELSSICGVHSDGCVRPKCTLPPDGTQTRAPPVRRCGPPRPPLHRVGELRGVR